MPIKKIIQNDFGYQITQRWLFAVDRILGNRSDGKITQQKLGDIVGINSSNINRLRQDPDRRVSIDACARLCDYYKVSAAWLLLEVGEMFGNTELLSAYNILEKRVTGLELSVTSIELQMNGKKRR